MKIDKKAIAIIFCLMFLTSQGSFAIEEEAKTNEKNKTKLSWFKKTNTIKVKKSKKKSKVEDIKLPEIKEGKSKIPFSELSVMSIDDCVQYALEHHPSLMVSKERINAAKSKIGTARSNYAPTLTGRVNYGHNETKIPNIHTEGDSGGFNIGVSQTIWDFGKTTAKIKMEKFNALSTQFDYEIGRASCRERV